MSERLFPWRPRPSQAVEKLIEELPATQLFLIQKQGPMSFVLCEDGAESHHKVLLGSQPTCSCRRGKNKELCIHHIFVMLRILRLSASNPLIWQLSLVDRELDEALWESGTRQVLAAQRDRKTSMQGATASAPVKRRALEQEDACSICYGDMRERGSRAAPELVWCRTGCGHNVHARCLHVWAKHQATLKQELTCPMCRSAWGAFSWRPLPALHRPHANQKAHTGSHCKGCDQAPIVGRLYVCLACARLQLCSACFEGGKHPQHSFACCHTPGAAQEPAHRDMQAALLAGLTFSGAALPSPTASAGVKKPSDKGSSRAALRKTGSIPCTDGAMSSHAVVPQARQQAGTAGCDEDVSGLLSISSHAQSRLPTKPSQALPACMDLPPLIQPVQQVSSRAASSSGQLGGQQAQGHQHSSVRKAGLKLVSASRLSQSAVRGQGSSYPGLQDIVGIAMGHDLSSRGHLSSEDPLQGEEKQKAGAVATPKVKGSPAKAPCSAAPSVDQRLQCTAGGFYGMLGQGIVCNPSRHHVGKPGTATQVPSMQPTRSVSQVSHNAAQQAKAHKVVSSARCEAPALETAGTKCRHVQ